MDNLMKFQRLMQAMAEKETDVCGDAMDRLERLGSMTSFVILQSGAAAELTVDSDDEASPELLGSSLMREIEHYQNLIARADSQLIESAGLAESVRRLTVPLVEQVRAAYECYLTAYQMLCEALQYGDAGCCSAALEVGREARGLMRSAYGSIGDMQDELPMVA
jgi:hypothetical protein